MKGFASIDKTCPLYSFSWEHHQQFQCGFFCPLFQPAIWLWPPRLYYSAQIQTKDIRVLERAYADSQGLTAEFILNVFVHINSLVGSNFDLAKMRYHSWYNPEWQQIEMYAVSNAAQEIRFPSFNTSFHWEKNERILAKLVAFDPERLQQLRFSICIRSDTSPTLMTGSRYCSSKADLSGDKAQFRLKSLAR
jgi:hypothetical protein